MPESGFQKTQFDFAASIRDPASDGPKDVTAARISLYQELFFNNVENCLGNSFPVLRSILGADVWRRLAADFFARHRSRSPFFAEMAEEFLDYLQNERGTWAEDPPFLLELAHYEWVELALSIAQGEPPVVCLPAKDDLLKYMVTISDLCWPLAYQFPVHQLSRDYQLKVPAVEPTCLAVYRDGADNVHFLELNPLTYRLLQYLQIHGPVVAGDCLREIAGDLDLSIQTNLQLHGAGLMQELAVRRVIGFSLV